VAAGAARAQEAGAAPRPNIVMILADDLGWADVGFHGSDIATPALDALAAEGVRFEQFYAQPMCTPTRAALMTGRYPFRYGLQTAVIPSGGLYGLALDERTLPEALDAAGYETALVGKWHLGHADPAYFPTARGFETAYGPLIGEIDHFEHTSHGVKDWYRDGVALEEEGYDTDLFAAEAVRFIAEAEEPFFLYLAFTAPHSPYQAPEDALAAYDGIADPQRRAYAAQVSRMDAAIAEVVAALEARGIRDETAIFFASDNGGTRSAAFAGEAAVAGELPPDNGPYREGKGTLYEGGVRVVALANWPGVIAPGVVEDPVHVVDLHPTILRLAGAEPAPGAKPLDGRDAWPAIAEGAPGPRDEVVVNVEPFRAAIRQGDMKLVWVPVLPPRVELYDVAADPSETTNLAEARPETVAALQDRLQGLAAEAAPPLFLMEMVRLGLNDAPAFPEGDPARFGEGAD
jgi:arylsulfatase A-like enzyme